jgi:transposase
METVIERCCGLDVHQSSVVACIIITDRRRKPRREIRTFGTITKDLETLRQWLKIEGITHVAMESTGVYWRPVYNLLHGAFTLVVANAHHIKNVPGRKTDVKDAEWIANLLRHGLINASYVPTPEIAERRDLTRYRRKLVGTASAEHNRTLKLLETANIKLASVAADVFGVSGLAMLRALASGATAAEEMADLARGRMRRKLAPLAAALDGRVTDHHRFLLTVALGRLDAPERDIALLDERIAVKAAPYNRQISLLMQTPGVIKYQITIAKLPLAKDVDDFRFDGTPINETLVRDLIGGNFLAHQRNVVLVGGTGTGKSHLAIAIARACAFVAVPEADSSMSLIWSTDLRPRADPDGRGAWPTICAARISSCSTSSAICRSHKLADSCCSTWSAGSVSRHR